MLRVFLAEDESAVRERLRDTVAWERHGYTFVGEAGDGEMALSMIRQAKPDILITDIHMPFMDGLSLSKLVLQEFPQMKVIVISAHADFAYAQQAVALGVARYLLKPVTASMLLPVLEEVKAKITEERAQQNYMARFRSEAQDYEHYARRTFFESIVAGQLTLPEIYEQAEKLEIDLRAQAYTVVLVSTKPERRVKEGYSEPGARIRDGMVAHFLKYPEYVLFRWDLTTYAVLIKGDCDKIGGYVQRCTDTVRSLYETYGPELDWYVASAAPTMRLSTLSKCFEEVSRMWAYRYILLKQHILNAETVSFLTGTDASCDLPDFDIAKADPAVVRSVLQRADAAEIPDFVEEYVRSMGKTLNSKPFCQYLMLSVRFTATEFVGGLDVSQKEFLAPLRCLHMVGQNVMLEEMKQYFTEILLRAVALRDKASGSQYRDVLKEAIGYVDANFRSEEMSLNRVAKAVNISPNYLSAVFSQELGMTFVEYLTAKRMEQARELLRSSDLRSGEIAASVGYKDPHYFSFLFKKTQGCTPSEYRAGKGETE